MNSGDRLLNDATQPPATVAASDCPADLFDAVHSGNPGDVDFYLGACDGAHSILELGCGTGRVAAALQGVGHRLIGLDVNLAALRLAHQRGIACFAADMADFALDARFDRILIPYNALYCLLSEARQRSCLRNARRHLAPRGQLLFDAYAVQGRGGRAVRHSAPTHLGQVVVRGRHWEVYEHSVMRAATQRVDASYRYVATDGADEFAGAIRQRYLLAEQVPALLADAGLSLLSLQGDFDGAPFGPDSEHLVVRAAAAR